MKANAKPIKIASHQAELNIQGTLSLAIHREARYKLAYLKTPSIIQPTHPAVKQDKGSAASSIKNFTPNSSKSIRPMARITRKAIQKISLPGKITIQPSKLKPNKAKTVSKNFAKQPIYASNLNVQDKKVPYNSTPSVFCQLYPLKNRN